MLVGAPPEDPIKLALRLGHPELIDARVPRIHQALFVELPIFIAIGAKPVSRVIVVLVRKTYRDAVAVESPCLFYESIVQLSGPFSREERDNLLSSGYKLGAVSPA